MDSIYLLLTVPQWVIFASIVVVVYGWVEKKRTFLKMGHICLAALGVYAFIAIVTGLAIPDIYIAEESLPMSGLGPEELPKEMFMVPIYWGLVVNGLFSLITMVLIWAQKKGFKWMAILTMLSSLGLFFMLFEAMKG